jgi:hypothetical protein
MKPLLWIFHSTFGCHHRQMSRVFTIKNEPAASASNVGKNSSIAGLRCIW